MRRCGISAPISARCRKTWWAARSNSARSASSSSRLLAGIVALLVTAGLHLILTRTALGSRMLAVAEDAAAAELMGIRPHRMQAIAWALAAGGDRHRRRADRELLLRGADRRRDARPRRLRHRRARRFRQRARRADRGAADRSHRVRCRPTRSAPSTRTSSSTPCSSSCCGCGRRDCWAKPDETRGMAQACSRHRTHARVRRRADRRPRLSAPVHDAVPAAARRAGAALCDRRVGVEHRRRLCRPDLGRARRVLRLRRLRRARLLSASRPAADRRPADRGRRQPC